MDNTYIAACGLCKFIDKFNKGFSLYNWEGGGYDAIELDRILSLFLDENNLKVNATFKKGTSNKKNRIKYRKIRLVSKHFTIFSKWIRQNKNQIIE